MVGATVLECICPGYHPSLTTYISKHFMNFDLMRRRKLTILRQYVYVTDWNKLFIFKIFHNKKTVSEDYGKEGH